MYDKLRMFNGSSAAAAAGWAWYGSAANPAHLGIHGAAPPTTHPVLSSHHFPGGGGGGGRPGDMQEDKKPGELGGENFFYTC